MNTSFKTLLIDDEPLARARLRRLLNKFEATFEIIGEAANGAEGLTLVEELQPDVIFWTSKCPNERL